MPVPGVGDITLLSGGGTDYSGLHSALLAVKVWSSGAAAYVWSGDGLAPDPLSYTQILFVDPTGAHNPATSPGGRTNVNDLWESGGPYVEAIGGGKETVNTQTTASGAVTLDLNLGNVQSLTLTGNVTSLTVSNTTASVSCTFTLVVKQDSTGSRTFTFMSGAKWAGGVAPTISSAANKVDVFTFMTVDNGTTWYGFIAGQGLA